MKITEKSRKKAEQYLADKDIRLEDFTDEQQVCAISYIRGRQLIKVVLPIFIFAIIFNVCMSFAYYRILNNNLFGALDNIAAEHNESELTGIDVETIKFFGKGCAMLGSNIGITTFLAFMFFLNTITMLVQRRQMKKVFDVFFV